MSANVSPNHPIFLIYSPWPSGQKSLNIHDTANVLSPQEDTSKNGTDNKADSEKTDSVSSQPVDTVNTICNIFSCQICVNMQSIIHSKAKNH